MNNSLQKLGFVDVGSRGGIPASYAPFADHLIQVLFEPDPLEFARLEQESQKFGDFVVIGAPLAHKDGEIDFHETNNPTCSSALRVNNAFINEYSISKHFSHKRTSRMKCTRYDTLYNSGRVPEPNIIKIDVQGFESRVLQGFGGLLHRSYAIELETHLYQIYEEQHLFGDIISYLSDYDMVLRRLSNSRSSDLNGDIHFDRDLVELDATFTKSRRWARSSSQAERDRLNLACRIVGVAANR